MRFGNDATAPDLHKFWITTHDAKALSAEYDGDLARIFFENKGLVVHKWLHYLEIYERHFSRFRGTRFKMLEIGVSKGGSLDMWREYFGPQATIYGIDINTDCLEFVTPPNQVRIGSQDDPEFLKKVVAEMGGVDLVLDDGSHIGRHQKASFETLFPLLSDGGVYAIEDLHTGYWPYYEGGYGRRDSGIGLIKQCIDDMHHWYHRHPPAVGGTDVSALHFYDSIAFLEKRKAREPVNAEMGRYEDLNFPGGS
jgi:hypothetical protein